MWEDVYSGEDEGTEARTERGGRGVLGSCYDGKNVP